MVDKLSALPAPCKSCPYRKDVPSGVWDASEYAKLPAYDGDIPEQAMNGAMMLFMCHQKNGCLCSGWLGCHGPSNLLAMRLHHEAVSPEVFDYSTDIPLFASGAEASSHGMSDINSPGIAANRVIKRLERKQQL